MHTSKRNQKLFIALSSLALLAIVALFIAPLCAAFMAGVGWKLGVVGGVALANAPAVMPQGEFQEKVLKGVGALEEKVDNKVGELVSKFDNLDKETKKTFEDITKLKNSANDTSSSFKEMERKLVTLQTQLRNEVRMAYGNPIARIQADEELRLRLNAAIRLAVGNNEGDMLRLVKSKFPSEFVKKALGEDSSPGSTLINQQLAGEIYDTLASYGIWNTFAVRQLGTKTNIFPVKTARAVCVAIINEGTQIPDDTNKTGTTVTATVVDLAVLLNVYMRLIEDAEFDVTADILEDFGEAAAYRLDWFCTQADGGADTTDGGMTGIFGGGGTAVNAAATHTKVATTDLTDWLNVILGVDPAVLTRDARWWMHPQQLVRSLAVKDANGRSIFLTALEAPSAKGIGSILGYPVTLGHVCPSTDAASAKVAAFGDPRGQVVGVRKDFSVEASDHHKWDYNQRSFRGIGRAATKIRRSQAFGVLTLAAS